MKSSVSAKSLLVIVRAGGRSSNHHGFYVRDIPVLLALLGGNFLVALAKLLFAGTTGGALWLYGYHLVRKAEPARIAAWRRANGLDP
jgi:hypothetical protein